MSLLFNLLDIPAEGLQIEHEVLASEVALSSDDGTFNNSLNCVGQIFSTDEHLANFQGTLRGKVIRECVRCLMSFEEDISLFCDAEFRPLPQSFVMPVSSKKNKKSSRRHDSEIEDEDEHAIDTYPIQDNQIDLLPALQEQLVLATPLQPLCGENCSGLCQVCGANLNEGVCGCCSPVTASSSLIADTRTPMSMKISQHSLSPLPKGV